MERYLAALTGTTPSRSRPSSVNVPVYANCNKMSEVNIIMLGMNKSVVSLAQITVEPSGWGGGTPLYGLYRYVQPQRAWFPSRFGQK